MQGKCGGQSALPMTAIIFGGLFWGMFATEKRKVVYPCRFQRLIQIHLSHQKHVSIRTKTRIKPRADAGFLLFNVVVGCIDKAQRRQLRHNVPQRQRQRHFKRAYLSANSHRTPPLIQRIIRNRHSPNPLQRQFGFDLIAQLVIVGKQLLQKLLASPQT